MKVIRRIAVSLRSNDRGQDLAEYCLITALIALIGLGIFWHVSGGLQGMWNSVNTSLASGNNPTSTQTTSGGHSGN